MFWLLLVVLAVVGGVSVVSWAVKTPPALPPGGRKALGSGDRAGRYDEDVIERTVRELRVGDVVVVDGRDFLCEGVIAYDEDGHRWTVGRLVDGRDERWLIIGIERGTSSPLRVLVRNDEEPITGYPPEALVVGSVRFALDKRGTATCQLFGDVTLGRVLQ